MRRTVVLALSTLLLPPLAPAAAPPPSAPVAIIYSLTGKVFRTDPGQQSRAAKLFDPLPAGAILQVDKGAGASLAFVSGQRWKLGGEGGGAQITLGETDLAQHSGDVQSLGKLPPLPRLKPIRKEDHAGKTPGAVTIRGERITGLYPRSDARTLAGTTVLRFQPLGGTEKYQVEIQDQQGAVVFSTETAEPEIAVPARILRPGTAYFWTVCTMDRPVSTGRGKASFMTLDAESVKRREGLLSSTKDPGGFALLAGLDRNLGLLAEARDELASALKTEPGNAALRAALVDVESELAGEDEPSGFVIEQAPPRSLGALAGLRTGDLLVSWCRSAAPASQPCLAEGRLDSPFSLFELETEQIPRGGVRLAGQRGAEKVAWNLLPGPLGVEIRPLLPAALEKLDQEARGLAKSGDLNTAAERWHTAGMAAVADRRPLSIWFKWRTANAFLRARQASRADPLFADAVAQAEQRGDTPAGFALLIDWAKAQQERGALSEAAESYRRALSLAQKLGPENLMTALTLHALGVMVDDQNKPEEAAQYFLQALEIRQKVAPKSCALSATLNVLGNAATKRGDPETAEAYYQRALGIDSGLGPGSLESAETLVNLGNLAVRRGDLTAGEERLRLARSILQEAEPHGQRLARVLNALGVVASMRGDSEATEEFFRQALAISETIDPLSRRTATQLHNLGALAGRRGDLAAAERYLRRALELDEKLAPESPETARDLFNLGNLEYDRDDLGGAQTDFLRALAIWEKVNIQGLEVAGILNGLGKVVADRGDLTAAEGYFRRALELWEKLTPGTQDMANALYNIGRLNRLQGKPQVAADFFCRAVNSMESQRARLGAGDRSAFGTQTDSFYAACVGARLQTQDRADAFRALERGRARAFLESLADRDLLSSSELPVELAGRRKELDAAYDTAQAKLAQLDPGDIKIIAELRARLWEIRVEQDELTAEIRRHSPRYASLHDPTPLDLAGVGKVLDPGTVLLSYAVDEEKTYLLVVEPSAGRGPGLTALTLPAGRSSLRSAVQAFRNLLQNGDSDRQALSTQAAKLYDLLIRPAERQIAGARRILISPDGPLHILPFGGLVRKGHYLAEWKPIHTILSATVYAELLKTRHPPSDPASLQLVAFGSPAYPKIPVDQNSETAPEVLAAVHRGLSLEPLPSSRAEVENLAALFPHSRTFLGAEATEEKAKETAASARLLHFACHGLLDEQTPLDSALALSLPEHPQKGQDNGLLQAWEIAEQLHLDADLVTLSACDTALGQDMGSEGLVGLTRAFQIAGARSVLASLWSVADTSTAELMKRFYGYLRQGKTKDEALRAAQTDLIHSAKLSHPYHWAAFQLSGDWQ